MVVIFQKARSPGLEDPGNLFGLIVPLVVDSVEKIVACKTGAMHLRANDLCEDSFRTKQWRNIKCTKNYRLSLHEDM